METNHIHGYWAPVEKELARVPELRAQELALASRFKAHLLEADLRIFGVDVLRVARCSELPRVDSFAHALGCLYVLEGSTLGSVFIARRLREQFDIGFGSGASFFNAYGTETGARWKQFREFVSRSTADVSGDEVVAGARETFERFEDWLSAARFSACAPESPVVPQPA